MKTARLPNQIKIIIIDDHRMFREQLASLINQAEDMKVCAEADNVRDGFDLINGIRPSIAIVDISLKGASGLELVKQLRSQAIDTPVLVLSMHEESLYAERALRAGANGYITKHEASADLMWRSRQQIHRWRRRLRRRFAREFLWLSSSIPNCHNGLKEECHRS